MDDGGNIVFKAQGVSLLIFTGDWYDNYLRLCLPMFWSIDSPEERLQALDTANTINHQYRVGKCVLVKNQNGDESVWAEFSMYLPDVLKNSDVFSPLMGRGIEIIGAICYEFRSRMP